MLSNSFIRRERPPRKPIKHSVRLLKPVEAVIDGVLVRKSQFVDFDIAASLADFRSQDFDISNILALGATSVLKPTYVSPMSDMNVADKFDNYTISTPENQ